MKLYYTPGACSLSPHIVLREAGAQFGLVRVDLKTHRTESGQDFTEINPKGYVPVLQLDDGRLLTEGVAIVQYIADTFPSTKLAPIAGTFERAQLQEQLNFIATEFHKAFSPLFSPDISDTARTAAIKKIESRLDLFEHTFSDGRHYLLGNDFSVADAYLFTISTWTGHMKIDLKKWPKLAAFVERVRARPKVQEALKAEGLLK
jgi:glutathione S-transferase